MKFNDLSEEKEQEGYYDFDIDFNLRYFWDITSLDKIARHIRNPFEAS